ncbi:hybrid sensor histidine kinase/response regulator, partial [Pararhodospirillum oryzae]|uniref:hybrid sensor histidine kinase/response regulator n=1 Tax=Pararhodospirillum oryzae TaxID=478448 RepID=UPI0011BF7AC0
APAPAPPPDIRLKTAETVRVALPRLDDLIKLMGEVVSSHARLHQRLADLHALERDLGLDARARAMMQGFARDLRDDVFAQDLLMRDLHARALVMRMLPLAIVFEPAARLARDLARSLGKDVNTQTSGMEIELDRQLIDRLSDPIVHLLRNAVDHGIEPPAERVRAGKPPHGTLTLSARQDGGFVVIDLHDDGRGLALEAIRAKAVRKAMMTPEQAAALPEAEVVDLIFRPGFSTSALITDVSGRGVGMDVVKRAVVDDLQGSLEVETRPGQGTTFSMRLPLSLAVMRILLVEAGGEPFAFTAQTVVQLLKVPVERLLCVAEREAVVVQNEFVPVADLADLLDRPVPPRRPDADVLLVVVRARQEKLALRVDALIDEGDMVLKPVPAPLRALPLVAGMVMTGRNILVSVLHVPALLERAARARVFPGQDEAASEGPAARLRVLVVDDSLNTREIERDVLEAHGYVVTLAEDGRDGLDKALAEPFDAVLTDVEMPAMDGFTLTATLRRDPRYATTPIIIITSREKEEDKRRGIQVGADAYIVKGDFEQGNLLETLNSLLA